LKTVKGTKKYIRDVFAYQEAPDFFFFDDWDVLKKNRETMK
jgi:hypothetical protein